MTENPMTDPRRIFEVLWMRRQARLEGTPACWDWDPTPPPLAERYADFSPEALAYLGDSLVLESWQADRCAICECLGDLVEDHDHLTGLTRGRLCRSCNSMEGAAYRDYPVFERYRERYPTLILGLTIRYIDPRGNPTTAQEQRKWEQQVFGDKPSEPGDNAMRGVL